MNRIGFLIGGHLMRVHTAAIILAGENPIEAVAEEAIQTIATDVELTLGGVTMHLAAFMDPDHWSEDWERAGIEDVHEWIAGLVDVEVP